MASGFEDVLEQLSQGVANRPERSGAKTEIELPVTAVAETGTPDVRAVERPDVATAAADQHAPLGRHRAWRAGDKMDEVHVRG